tara:strand:- start:4507 stop:4926 length:420 start_codon:yes stop_codon:yes gene_type:complete
MISGEDNFVLTSSLTDVMMELNLIDFSGAEILCLTTVNVHHIDALGSKLFEFGAELFCQKNTGSNNHKRMALVCHLHARQNVFKDAHGLATTRRDDNLTFVVIPHGIDCSLLVGTKGDGQGVLSNDLIIADSEGTQAPL